MKKVLLAVSAHPDDNEFACGGTMFKFKEKGFDIFLIVATNGENGQLSGYTKKFKYSEQFRIVEIKQPFK